MKRANRVDSVFRVLTPRGRGAVATIWLQSPDISEFGDQLFRAVNKRLFSSFPIGKIVYGRWMVGASAGEDVVVCRLGDDIAEVHSHGGDSVTNAISQTLQEMGFTEIGNEVCTSPHEHGIWRHEVQLELAAAITKQTALILLRQLELIPETVGQIEMDLRSGKVDVAKQRIIAMLEWKEFGTHLSKPWSVVLSGSPNVGKSSLINAIVGYDRTIVHDTPGTTRDVISEMTALKGWPMVIADTAGLRTASEKIEELGIQKAESTMKSADLLIHVTEPNQELPNQIAGMNPNAKVIGVVNKVDLLERIPANRDRLYSSATTGYGIDSLIERITELLIPEIPGDGQAIPVNEKQAARLEQTLEVLNQGQLENAIKAMNGL